MPAADVTGIKVDSVTSWRTGRVPGVAPALSLDLFAPHRLLAAPDNGQSAGGIS
jgi:hypothetical protein